MFPKRFTYGFIASSQACLVTSASKVLSGIWFLALGHFFAIPAAAQDLRFTQWHASDAVTNPAWAGSGNGGRFTANFKSQWPDMPQSFMSYRVAFDQPVGEVNSGIGVYVLKDDMGDQLLNSLQLGFQYMYQAKVTNKAAFNFGFQMGMIQRRLNWDKAQFFDQIDPVYGFNNAQGIPNPTSEPQPPSLSFTVLDLAAGVGFVTEKAYSGLSFLHLTTPPHSFYDNEEEQLPMAISFQGGLFFQQSKRKRDPFMIEPSLQVFVQEGNSQMQMGAAMAKSYVMGGLFLKNNFSGASDFCLLAGLRKDWMLFTYTYDLTLGGLAGETGGSHEVGLVFLIDGAGSSSKGKLGNVLPRPSVF